ncbi:hypothetical protein [Halorubrum sp. SD612]|uniref:hypothetical protein n=1 Tax=Halorubrum sp. SD612 TaxID=1855863 RepID=UPI001E5FE5D8|nr:hypothetical protein [Halorubrum sp. SD612]
MCALHAAAATADLVLAAATPDLVPTVPTAVGAVGPVTAVGGAGAIVIGLAFLARGASGPVDAVRLLRTTATSPVVLDGAARPIRVSGRAAAVDGETLPAPFGGGPALRVDYDAS